MSSRHFAQHVRVSSTDDLSYSSSSTGEINDTIHTIVTGRKCWKTMKGKGEVVWPPFLEAALVEGLEKYQPVESRTTRAFGRFPMRNKFISDYIFNATGKRRTPKQVGSRLQQLRDTAEGKRILQLLSSRHIAMMQPSKAPSRKDSSPDSVASTPSASPDSIAASLPPRSYVSIDVLPSSALSSPDTLSICPSPLVPAGDASFRAAPRALRAIDPTVAFLSHSALAAHSSFSVLRANIPVHAERTALQLCESSVLPAQAWPSQIECRFVYRTQFVPQFWARLCDAPDPTEYTVMQEIVRTPAPGDAPGSADVLLSVVYQFATPARSPPLSPAPSSGSSTAPHRAFSAESSPELDDLLLYSALEPPAPPYAAPPGLITRDEEGYASLPPSPLDHAPAEWALPHLASHAGGALCAPAPAPAYADGFGVYDGAFGVPQYTFDAPFAL